MACSCGSKKSSSDKFTVTKPGGEKITFSNEVDAAAAATRYGGSYVKQTA